MLFVAETITPELACVSVMSMVSGSQTDGSWIIIFNFEIRIQGQSDNTGGLTGRYLQRSWSCHHGWHSQ